MNVSVLDYSKVDHVNYNDQMVEVNHIIDTDLDTQSILNTYVNLGAMYERSNELSKAVEVYKSGIELARLYGDKETAREFSFTLLGLLD